nr:universal stress protein [uncultured Flavobacterium sp.]
MKHILVPTDFSEQAEYALKAAAQLAKKNNASIYLLHLLELPSQMSDAVSSGKSIPEVILFIRKANERLENIKSQSYLDGIVVESSVQLEKAFSGILSFNETNEIDLIIMGSHGSSNTEHLLIGSNTEKVVRLSKAPVLVIKKDPGEFQIEKIVFASDFSKETKKPFKKLLKFSQDTNAKLLLVMINIPNSFKTTQKSDQILEKFLRKHDLENYSTHVYNDTNVENGITNFAKSKEADLISICTHGRTRLSHFFSGSISQGLINHESRPVLTFRI